MRYVFPFPAIIPCLCALVSMSSPCNAENIIFPRFRSGIVDASGIIDVTKAYGVDNTGQTDVTAKLQQAFDEHHTWITIYLPNGTYLVSNTITMTPTCESHDGTGCISGPILQGQSRAGTIIKLKDNTFTNASSPKAVIITASGVAQNFNRGVHNLTVLVGSGNPGAMGVSWYANNVGLMSEVDIIATGGGAIGLDLGYGEQGPSGVHDVYVKGFAVGCKSDALASVTIWNLTIENASQYGVLNNNRYLFIENLICRNAAVGVRNQDGMTLVNAQLTGGNSTKSAIANTGSLFARNISTQGYQKALTTSGRAGPAGMTFDEYSSAQTSQFPSPTHSMNLPAPPVPDVPWEQDSTKWGNVWANIGGLGGNRKTDSASLQSLIDNPNLTTVCVPAGKLYQINGDIYIRGNIRRLVGTAGNMSGTGRFVITDQLTQPVFKMEKFLGLPIVNQSDKTVIIESVLADLISTGTGDLFINDFGGDVNINNASERVWARQFNLEGNGSTHTSLMIQKVKSMRIIGWKDEGDGNAATIQSGVLEILGFLQYATNLSTTGQNMFVVKDGAQFCLGGLVQNSFSGTEYHNLVQETRNGVTRLLTMEQNGGYNLPLYCGYDSASVANAVQVRAFIDHRSRPVMPSMRVAGRSIIITGARRVNGNPPPVELFAVDGSRMISCRAKFLGGNSYLFEEVPGGAYIAVLAGDRHAAQRFVIR